MAAEINFASREVTCKIVYYGPGRSGKTTSLEWVHAQAPPESVGEMVSVATETDRTIFFDYLSLDLGQIAGMTTKFGVYTVPGQVYYNATRKIVLQGADGVVFVADSHPDKRQENIESIENLAANLKENGLDVSDIPIVFEWNKRDLSDAMSVDEMERDLNPRGLPSFETIATEGKGILKALKTLAGTVIDSLNEDVQGEAAPPAGDEPADEPVEPVEEEEPVAAAVAPVAAEEPVSAPVAPVPAEEPGAYFGGGPPEEAPAEPVAELPAEEPAQPDVVASEAALIEAFPEVGQRETEPVAEAPPVEKPKSSTSARLGRKKSRSGTTAAARAPRRFRWRLVAGALGAAFLVGVQWGSFWPEASGGWYELAAATGGWIWLRYVAMGGVLLGVLLLCGLTGAGLGRSLPSSFGMGLCCMAILSVVLAGYRANYPAPPPGTETSEPAGVRMAEVGLVPGLFGRTIVLQRTQEKLDEREAELEGLKALQIKAQMELSEAQTELTDARAGMKAELGAARTLAATLAEQLKEAGAASADSKRLLAEARAAADAQRAITAKLKKQLTAKEAEVRAIRRELEALKTQMREPHEERPGGEPVP